MPALSLPPEVADVLRSFYTCEVTTVNRQGQPLTWPSVVYFDEEAGAFFLSVSIAFPVKAQNARRHPQVALLFSDPTGSALTHPPAVLVQGDATVAEVLEQTEKSRGLARLVRQRQPDSRRFLANDLSRRLFSWYLFQRIGITVRPRRFLVWANRDMRHTPEEIEASYVE